MQLDAVGVAAIRKELADRLLNARLERITQPSRGDLLFALRKGTLQYRLFFSETPRPWLGLIEKTPANPASPPAFCMLLRKYLPGGRIVRILQPSFEKRLSLAVEHFENVGGLIEYCLHFELMGRHGNVIIADQNGLILDALRRTKGESAGRRLEPGLPYQPPDASSRINPDGLAADTFHNLLHYAPPDTTLHDLLQRKLLGLSPETIAEMAAAAGLTPDRKISSLAMGEREALRSILNTLVATVHAERFDPREITNTDGRMQAVSPLPSLRTLEGMVQKPTPCFSSAFGDLMLRETRQEHLARRRRSVAGRIETGIAKLERKQAKQLVELSRSEQAELHKERGNLLLAHLGGIPKGASSVEMPSFEDPFAPITIPLDPALNPSANAQMHFRRYQRAKRAQKAVAAQLAKTGDDLAYLREIAFNLSLAETEEELAEIAAEMDGGTPAAANKKAVTSPEYRRFLSLDGWEMYIGRNSKQNERLTFGLAGPEDLWLHARQIPGAHVIVKQKDNDRLPPSTLLDAANLAVYHSRARDGSKVAVDYTRRKHVRKRPGGHPGMVHYDRFQTVIIDPDREILRRLIGSS